MSYDEDYQLALKLQNELDALEEDNVSNVVIMCDCKNTFDFYSFQSGPL